MIKRRLTVVPTGRSMPRTKQNPVKDLYPLSGKQAFDRILDDPNPRVLVEGMAHVDFYWLIKKIGEGECLPILELASTEQWQYLLDMELWNKDRIDLSQVDQWLSRLLRADSRRLVKWLFSGGQSLSFYFLFRSVQVIIREEGDDREVPEGFITLDGVHYVRVLNPDMNETIHALLRLMVREDYLRYQAILEGLAGVIPAEAEEQMYRMRSVRLAEHGFLPFEEALSVYSPINCESLSPVKNLTPPLGFMDNDEWRNELVPQSLFFHLEKADLFTKVVAGTSDTFFQERIYLEFAGLCNQILSADGSVINDLDVLIRTCRRAAGYLNITLEKICDGDISLAVQLLKQHSLINVFRAGFGLALRLKWELERWINNSWFAGNGLDPAFWGELWGNTLRGLLLKKPLLFCGETEAETYRDFRSLSEIRFCYDICNNVKILDYYFAKLDEQFHLGESRIDNPEQTFHPLLFNLWSRRILGLPLSFEGIFLEQAKAFFDLLRAEEKGPPYYMLRYENIFVSDMTGLIPTSEKENGVLLEQVLRSIWRSFAEEYLYVSAENLNQKFSPFLEIRTLPA